MVEDHDGVANDATETYALPHAEQFWPMRILRGDSRRVQVYNVYVIHRKKTLSARPRPTHCDKNILVVSVGRRGFPTAL
jgi:hypothetical protein